jgi:hypothetical protein
VDPGRDIKEPPLVNVWALAHPADIKESERVIARALLKAVRATDPGAHAIEVSEASGWIAHSERSQLWRRSPPRLPTLATEARKRAEDFLRDFTRALAEPAARREAPALAEISLVPQLLEPVQISLVPHPDGIGWDHWLYRAQPLVVAGATASRKAAIFGAQIEVRVGDGGRIISYRSRYRPITAERVTSPLTPIRAPEPEAHHEHDEHEHEPPSLVYVLEGDGIPQYYLAPYHLVLDGHDLTLASASQWSLVVALDAALEDDGTRVTAVVDGGSGAYAFDWGVYAIDAMAEGYRSLGGGSSVTVPNRANIVLLNVRDQATGAFKHHQEQVYSTPLVADPQPPAASL